MIDFHRILVVAAHPDDEVLGCGGAIARMASLGREVHIALLADGVSSRYGTSQRLDVSTHAEELQSRRNSARKAAEILGAKSVWFGDFPDNRMDTVPLLDIVQAIEQLIEQYRPDTVFTHHYGDVNVDHRRIHEAITAACRPQPGCFVQNILCFEVPSSTEWQLPGRETVFSPNFYIGLDAEAIGAREEALGLYTDELRAWPHARSTTAIEASLRRRGAEAGLHAAEAFTLARSILRCF